RVATNSHAMVDAQLPPKAADGAAAPLPTFIDGTPYLPFSEARRRDVTDFVELHAKSAEEVLTWSQTLPPGFAPVFLDAHATADPPQVHAIAAKITNPPRFRMTLTPFTKKTGDGEIRRKMSSAGYRSMNNVYVKSDSGLQRLQTWVKDDVYGFSWW